MLRDGWTRVQIPAGLMVRDARLDGQPVSLVEGPPPHVLLSRAGRFVLTLDIVIPLTSVGRRRIDRAARVAVADLARDAHAAAERRRSVGRRRLRRRSAPRTGGESRWTAFGRPNQPLTLSWKRKVDDRRAEQPLRMRARVTTLVGLGEDIVRRSPQRFASRCCRDSRAKSRSRCPPASSSIR